MPTLEKRSMGIGIPIPMLRFLHFFHKSKKNMCRNASGDLNDAGAAQIVKPKIHKPKTLSRSGLLTNYALTWRF